MQCTSAQRASTPGALPESPTSTGATTAATCLRARHPSTASALRHCPTHGHGSYHEPHAVPRVRPLALAPNVSVHSSTTRASACRGAACSDAERGCVQQSTKGECATTLGGGGARKDIRHPNRRGGRAMIMHDKGGQEGVLYRVPGRRGKGPKFR